MLRHKTLEHATHLNIFKFLLHSSRSMGNMCGNEFQGCGVTVEGTENWIRLSLLIQPNDRDSRFDIAACIVKNGTKHLSGWLKCLSKDGPLRRS